MINGHPINGAPINGAAGSSIAPPTPIVAGFAYVWALAVVMGADDVTAQLAGRVTIDREEGAAGLAGFTLFVPPGTPVVPTDWIGRPVTIDYITTSQGNTTQARRFTGILVQPVWDPVSRLLSCDCTDNLQQRVEAMTVDAIDALVGGWWSADVFDPVEGRSHWDYALERLSTVPVSLDCAPTGELRVTSWYAQAPAFGFGPGTTIYQSASVDLAEQSRITNRIEIEFAYRYQRLWQRNQSYAWKAPATGSNTGILGFCAWRSESHELPTKEMVDDAAAGVGMTVVSPDYYELPPTHPDPCDTGSPWINRFDNLLLGVSWIGARRWVQPLTERYTLTVATPAGEAEQGQAVQRVSYTLDIDDPAAEEWVDEPILGGDSGATDLGDGARRSEVATVALRAGATSLIAAARQTAASWELPASMALGIDLAHTLEISDQGLHAVGKCRRIVDTFDLDSGAAITSVSVAVMRGGGISDALDVPPLLIDGVRADDGLSINLPTQIGGKLTSPVYDDEQPGFAGNYSVSQSPSLEVFPRRLDAPADEIPESDRDEHEAAGEVLYRVGIPNDTLELT